jgi:hypothetical protein
MSTDISGLETWSQWRIQRISQVSWNRNSKCNHPEILTHSNKMPSIQFLLTVFLWKVYQLMNHQATLNICNSRWLKKYVPTKSRGLAFFYHHNPSCLLYKYGNKIWKLRKQLLQPCPPYRKSISVSYCLHCELSQWGIVGRCQSKILIAHIQIAELLNYRQYN